jgi:hypothetical protein
MANKIVKDSALPIFVKDVQVAASGTDSSSANASFPKANDLVQVGAVAGLIGQRPRKGEDGAFYSTVDTAALVRISGVSGTFTDKQPVYLNGSTKAIAGAAGSGLACIGYADRPKTNSASGDLWVQLVPSATGA